MKPNFHHRKSIRLKGYDYSKAGLYYITICTQDRSCLFGDVLDGEMFLNQAGKMIEKWYFKLESKYSDIKCHEMVIMPNHLHCIIENVGPVGTNAEADPRVCLEQNVLGEHIDAEVITVDIEGNHDEVNDEDWAEPDIGQEYIGNNEHVGRDEHVGSSLPRVMQWFKTMSTNEYIQGVKTHGWPRFNGKLWQRSYHERIIHDEHSYNNISQYIRNNPKKWSADKFKLN